MKNNEALSIMQRFLIFKTYNIGIARFYVVLNEKNH